MKHYYALIMAGGVGTRLWPMSRQNMPKQLLPLIGEHSMFKTSVERLAPLFTPDRVYVVAGREYIDALRADAPEIPGENFVAEPYGKNTGPAIGLAIAVIQKRDPQATIAILTADHHIGLTEKFRGVLSAAYELAQKDYIITLGISPSFPSTGFGYIQQGEELECINDFKCFVSLGFTEKPDAVRAKQFLSSGQYSWNGGMFIWKASRAMAELKRQQPEIYSLLKELEPAVDVQGFAAKLDEIWEKMPKISIDYAIMENARNMAVIPADIGWNDVGSWEALFDVLPQDESGNCSKGQKEDKHIILNTQNSLVFSDRLTVTIGVEDIIIVDTEDVLLVCHKERAQDVKDVVAHLRENENSDYL